jgi:hypothetical protein
MDKFYKSAKQCFYLTRMNGKINQTENQTEINQNGTEGGALKLIDMNKVNMLREVIEGVNREADQLRNELRSGVVPINIDPLVSVDVDFSPIKVDEYVAREGFGENEIYITGVRVRDSKVTFYMHKDPEMEDDPFIFRIDTRVTIEIWELIMLSMVVDNIIDALKKEKEEFRKRIAEIRATGLTL